MYGEFPSPTGVNYYEFISYSYFYGTYWKQFPSPTGVNYYEIINRWYDATCDLLMDCFRPQQGLTIMNIDIITNNVIC